MNHHLPGILVICAGLLPASFAAIKTGGNSSELDYNRDVRPILSEHCFACHGPDKAQRKADLRLDVRQSAMGPQGSVPGKADESGLVPRISWDAPEEVMPPLESHKPLSEDQKDLLKRWV